MNDWMANLISQCLADIPHGKYRDRTEKELRDHMETLYLSLTEGGMDPNQARGETLRAMGEPNKLKNEYRAAWQQSLPEQLDYRLKTWAWGCVVMFGAHFLVLSVIGFVWGIADLLSGDSRGPWVRMIRDTLGDLNNSMLCCYLLPLVSALILGAYYLSCKFQTSRHPVWQIGAGLSFHWVSIAMIQGFLKAGDGPFFWEQFKDYFSYTATYYSLTFALCILLGVVFGHMSVKMKRAVVVYPPRLS